MKKWEDLTEQELTHMNYAIAAYAGHSSHLPDNKEYEKHLEKFMHYLCRSFGVDEPKSIVHTYCPDSSGLQ